MIKAAKWRTPRDDLFCSLLRFYCLLTTQKFVTFSTPCCRGRVTVNASLQNAHNFTREPLNFNPQTCNLTHKPMNFNYTINGRLCFCVRLSRENDQSANELALESLPQSALQSWEYPSHFPMAPQVCLPACSPHSSLNAERRNGKR